MFWLCRLWISRKTGQKSALEGGLAAYNGGGSRVRRWLARDKQDNVLYRETRLNVPFVLKLYGEFMDM